MTSQNVCCEKKSIQTYGNFWLFCLPSEPLDSTAPAESTSIWMTTASKCAVMLYCVSLHCTGLHINMSILVFKGTVHPKILLRLAIFTSLDSFGVSWQVLEISVVEISAFSQT